MNPFEEFISRAKGAVDVIGEKAGQFMDVSKLNLKLIELKSQLKSEFEELGRIVYESNGEKVAEDKKVATQIQIIKQLNQEIENSKTQIAFAKNKILCKSCGHHNEIEASYCAKCGGSLKTEEEKLNDNSSEVEEDDFAEFDD